MIYEVLRKKRLTSPVGCCLLVKDAMKEASFQNPCVFISAHIFSQVGAHILIVFNI